MGDIKKVIKEVVKFNKGEPISTYKLTYDSQQNQLEPIYYWILDFIQDAGWETEKITDNFTSSPGSGHFQEMGMRATKMQEEGMKILGGLNQVIKSTLNLIYDLKEFQMRLSHYDDYNSDNAKDKEQGSLALKQIWLDNVDLKRGRGSIHQMAAELGYTTIREAFMMADSIEDLKKMNKDKDGALINDQVYRILVPRMSEFLKWVDYSERELRKRFKIEKSYLKSQVETIKMYSSWMKPYLKAAEELRQRGFDGNAALVNAFSTSMFELSLLGKKKAKVPSKFDKYPMKRDYHPIVLINFVYRGHISQRVTQKGDYGFAGGGRVDITFDSYAVNSEEYQLIMDKLKNEEVADSMSFSGDVAAEALETLKEDLEEFLKEPDKEKDAAEKKKAEEEKKKEQDINPFTALFGVFFKKKEKKSAEKKKVESVDEIKKDNYIEQAVRANAAKDAVGGLYTLYDVYKKVHGFQSSPESFENGGGESAWEKKSQGGKIGFKNAWHGGFDKIS